MANAEYFAPTELGQALKLLAERGSGITVLAGGTDLMPLINGHQLRPTTLLNIEKLGLSYIREKDGGLVIGAATTLDDIATSRLVAEKAPILADAAIEMGSAAIRNAATIGGNMVTGSRAADLPPPLLALDAELVLVSERGERVVPVAKFFEGSHKTVRSADELLTEIRVPPVKGQIAFVRLGRRKVFSCAVASAAVRLVMDGDKCTEARIVAGCMAPTPVRCHGVEEVLNGKPLTPELVANAATRAIEECKPFSDPRASAWYRRRVIKTLVERAINQACGL